VLWTGQRFCIAVHHDPEKAAENAQAAAFVDGRKLSPEARLIQEKVASLKKRFPVRSGRRQSRSQILSRLPVSGQGDKLPAGKDAPQSITGFGQSLAPSFFSVQNAKNGGHVKTGFLHFQASL
jgi:hypothetical protein